MRHPWPLALLLSLFVLSPACDDEADDDSASGDDDDSAEQLPPPGPFMAGTATVEIPAPLGSPTIGFGQIGADPSPTPFADIIPGTTRQHGALTLRAVALSRGDDYEAIFLVGDLLYMGTQARSGILIELENRLGRDLDDALILGGNHTHGGPGRFVDKTGPFELGFDRFMPEMLVRLQNAAADVVEQALADLAPAEVGYVMASTDEAHNDRRCANDHLPLLQENPSLPTIAVQRDGQIDALIMSYAYHGTILDADTLTLSGDMGSVVQWKVAERFDNPVNVLFFNSWGGDASPDNPEIDPAAVGAPQPDDYDRMEALGEVIADAVLPELDAIVFTDEPEISMVSTYVPIDHELLEYDSDEFELCENGCIYCAQGIDGNCDDDTSMYELGWEMDDMCVPFPEDDPAFDVTLFSAGRIGDLYFVTGNGEWVTSLADIVMTEVQTLDGVDDVMFLGYAQDTLGYSLTYEDWWQGDYETGGTLWGPKQGDYLADRLVEIFNAWHDPTYTLPFDEPAPLPAWSGYDYEPYAPEGALGVGDIAEDVPAVVSSTDIVTFTVQGTDPWLGRPVATLEQDTGDGFAPVTHADGTPVNSDGYEFWTDLTTDPSYADQMPAIRTFNWEFSFPMTHRVATAVTDLSGSFQFRIVIPTDQDGGTEEVTTGAFTVVQAAQASAGTTPSQMWKRGVGR
jgi:neutral ceramidase